MSPYRAVLLALFVVGGALTAAVPAGATVHDGAATPEVAAPTGDGVGLADARPTPAANTGLAANNSTDNSSLGADISSFMQSSAAEADGAVETGMWSAAFNGTENQSVRTELVEKRTAELRRQLAELRERREDLVAEREAGNVSETAYKAKISRLIGDIDALQSAIDTTTSRAREVNASVETLGGLRTEARNLTGPELSSAARNLTGVGNGEGGPPDRAGNGNGVGNGTAANAAIETANATTPGNAGNANAAAGAGNGNGVGNESGLADAGNETGVGNGTGFAGAGNGTDNGVGNAPTNGSSGSSGNGDGASAADDPALADRFDRVSTAFVASIGPSSPA